MKKTMISVPTMYADHHVLRIREALLALPGVSGVEASAAARSVTLEYDEGTTSEKALRDAASAAGYPPDEAPALGAFAERHKDGSAWYAVIQRTTTTERRDREMAGDFRRY
jgi:copper chaperone CopZ